VIPRLRTDLKLIPLGIYFFHSDATITSIFAALLASVGTAIYARRAYYRERSLFETNPDPPAQVPRKIS
jgi:hypothetical protein